MNLIPYGRQDINQSDIDNVVDILKSDFLTQGPAVAAFENALAGYCGAKYAVAVNSATSALHIACLALGVSRGDIVWTTPITFVASANCALYCGATIDFVDIDPLTYNISIEALSEKLSEAKKNGKLPKVLIPVHLCGQPCNMASIYDLSQKYGFNIIEDASHAVGGKYGDCYIGSCQYSDITIFSFHPVKIITTGEGGMSMTNDEHLANKMLLLRGHGITRDENEMTHTSDGPWYYQQIDLGYNYRMTDIQAALGLSQMQRLDEFVAKRQKIACNYDNFLVNLPVRRPYRMLDSYSAMHLYVIRLNLLEIKNSRRQVFESLREMGIGVNLHYIPVYLQPYYKNLGFKLGYCLEAERYYGEAISLPMYPSLTATQQDRVISALGEALN